MAGFTSNTPPRRQGIRGPGTIIASAMPGAESSTYTGTIGGTKRPKTDDGFDGMRFLPENRRMSAKKRAL